MRKNIVIIGAGSVSFTTGLVADLVLTPDMGPWELRLVDIDADALDVALGLARRMAEQRGAAISVTGSLDRREMLTGADVVVCTIAVGGRQARLLDVRIPRKYGVFQPVADTVMAGGISRAMRMVPALVDIARDVGDLCPDAWFFNYANPMAVNCWAVRRATGVPMVGLCIGVSSVIGDLAKMIGAPLDEVTALYAGVNHLTFIHDLRRRGEDAWPLVRSRLAVEESRGGDARGTEPEIPGGDTTLAPDSWVPKRTDNPFSWSLFDAYGAYPAVNDRHVVEFFPERFPQGQYYGRTLGVDAFALDSFIEHGQARFEQMRAWGTGAQPLDASIFERRVGEHSKLLDILRSIYRDRRRVFAANLPNAGSVPGLPRDAVLEMPAVATSGGLRAIQQMDFPAILAAVLDGKLASIELTVEAALAGDRDLMREAILLDGSVSDPGAAADLTHELLEAHRQYLPQFFPAG
jgi:alpha-galactosidase